MIKIVTGNLMDADVEAVVNTVNTVGVMGKGIALQFKRAFPENFRAYERACKQGDVKLGRMFVYETRSLYGPRYIVNFPTKSHWKAVSRLEDIRAGLRSLTETIEKLGIKSIAVPPLGCGLGGLSWNEVRPIIENALEPFADVDVRLYEPAGAPAAERMKVATARPQMTIGRAALIGLIDRYKVPGYDYLLSLLEVHKLAYFLQCAGQPLKLAFQKGIYGPYADSLRHVLSRIEGHFISGYGDGRNSPETPLALLPGAAEEAARFLGDHPKTREHFDRVAEVIEGFETPYGMELLSSVHWVAMRENASARTSAEDAAAGVLNWNERKRRIFKPEHIRLAWARLRDAGWLEETPS
ncbi:MAG: macro domain-containing protein [Elusimicrobia bacterium]|nr:macro domain-containing protein [Elusimicrobiota bacterium]